MTKGMPNFARILAASAAAPDRKDTAYRSQVDEAPLSADEARAVLELAWLMASANGKVNVDELATFKALAHPLFPEHAFKQVFAWMPEAPALDEDRARQVAARLQRRTAREA